VKKLAAELVGTFVLVFVGCSAAVIAGHAIGLLGVALAFGLALMAMIYALGPISGGHFNPAVTIGMWVAGRIKWMDALGYIASQCVGAVLACGLLLFIAGSAPGYSLEVDGLAQNGYGLGYMGGYSMEAAFAAEVVATAIFLMVILSVTSKGAPAGFAGLVIGLSLSTLILAIINITGASLNPARSLGPALLAGGTALAQLPLFLLAPALGGALGALVFKRLEQK
jgi:aquaporin Z